MNKIAIHALASTLCLSGFYPARAEAAPVASSADQVLPDATQAAASPADTSSADTAGLVDIVVTARRQKESAQDVPISLTSISADALRQGQFARVEDMNQFSPSLNIVMPTPGNTSFSIRGIGANPGAIGLSSSAATFLDGVYLGKLGMSGVDLIDLQQVDVLRGPQGTLFGKNTTAGILDIKTALPSFAWSGIGQVGLGNLGYQQYQAAITGPLSDTLAFRLTGYRSLRNGFVHDSTTGDDYSDQGRWGLRGQLLFKPAGNFTLRIIADYHREIDSAATAVLTSYGATPAAYQAKLAAIGATVAIDPNGGTTTMDTAPQVRSTNKGVSGEINWGLGHGLNLTSITAWRQWDYFTSVDVDLTDRFVVRVGTNFLRNKQLTQEVRLATAPDKPVSAIVGAFYYNQNAEQDSRTTYGPDAAAYLTGVPNALLPVFALRVPAVAALIPYNNSRWDVWTTPQVRSYALFGQTVWHVTPRLNLTGGLRETYERETMSVRRDTPISTATGQSVAALAGNAYPLTVVPPVGNWSTSWLASADYALAHAVRAYALVSHGAKAAGINSTLPTALGLQSLIVQPETATNYELGIKSRFAHNRIQMNLSVFNTDISDYQANYSVTVPGTTTTVSIITNVGKVRTRGVELDATAVPVRGLTLGLNGSYNEAVFVSYPNGPCPVEVIGQAICDLSGKPVPQAPKWIANATISYRTDLGGGVVGVVGGNYAWRSSRYGYIDDSAYTRIPGTGLLNADIGIELADGRYQLSLWGKNLTNLRQPAAYLNYGSVVPGNYAAYFIEPRIYGLRVRASF